MQGDFSRDSFDPLRCFSRVLTQQGRVALDADWNEMQAIQLHLLRRLAADLIGPHGGVADGFEIVKEGDVRNNFRIRAGRYYVDGWLCENGPQDVLYFDRDGGAGQPFHRPELLIDSGKRYLVYLDVWERHLSWPETDGPNEIERRTSPALREVALGGADTASRAQAVWQVKTLELDARENQDDWTDWLRTRWPPSARGMLKASVKFPGSADSKNPCSIAPSARYRGLKNQLYRVEIHSPSTSAEGATFKWSRENASVLFPIAEIDGKSIKLSEWWRDDRLRLSEGEWVEILDDDVSLQQIANPLRRVTTIDLDTMSVGLDAAAPAIDLSRHPILRRWDHRGRRSASAGYGVLANDNALRIDKGRIELEDGIQIEFDHAVPAARYRTGDYWLIAARTAIADVVWPRESDGNTAPLLPHGVEHHYAPLAILETDGGITSLRRAIKHIAS